MIVMREELCAGLIACVQGLDASSVDLRLSMMDLRAMLNEASAVDVECRMVQGTLATSTWVSVDYRDDSGISWHLVADIAPNTLEEFKNANEEGRWTESGGCLVAPLTAAEMRLTMDKEINRNGS